MNVLLNLSGDFVLLIRQECHMAPSMVNGFKVTDNALIIEY